MRMDVRLGVFFSMVIVLALGGYFVYPRGDGETIPLTGEVKPVGGADAPAKLASDAQKATDGQKSMIPPRGQRKAQKTPIANPPARDPLQNRTNKSTRLADRAARKGDLPVSGASLGDRSRSIPAKSPLRPGSGTPAAQRPTPGSQHVAKRTALPTDAPTQAPGALAANSLTEKPGTPTPPGLLAATRTAPASETEPAVDLHRVQPGDTFASLAQAYYGASNHADFLMKANPDVDPAKMQIGATIRVPALADRNSAKATPVAGAARKSASMAAATKTYTVRPGDSFYRIAEEQLGDATRWNELFELNKTVVGTDPSRLKVGQVLSLPSK